MRMRNRFLSRGKRRGRREPYAAPVVDDGAPYSSWGYGTVDQTLPLFFPSVRSQMRQESVPTPDYYVDATAGDDSGTGAIGDPWQTVTKALAAPDGSVVAFRTGNYGALTESGGTTRAQYLRLIAATGESPVLSQIVIGHGSSTDSYLWIEGFDVTNDSTTVLVALDYCNYIKIVDCEIHGDWWAISNEGVQAFEINDCQDILVERCNLHEIESGVFIADTTRCTLRRNKIAVKAGSGIRYAGNNAYGVIEYNHIYGEAYTPYPTDPEAVIGPHASVISIRSNDLIIRGNHMHGMGSSSGVMFYDPDAVGGEDAYSNITIENNAIYNISNHYAMRMYNLGENVVVRNNLIMSMARSGSCDGFTPDARYRFETALVVHNVADGYDGSGLSLYNNIMIGITNVPDTVTEGNNQCWSWIGDGNVWASASPSGTSAVNAPGYMGCGNQSDIFENGFFATDPDFWFAAGGTTDWTLAAGSDGINFGDASNQPSTSIGSLDADGFVLDDGKARSASAHDVGPFQS